jgi:hypothetical protein
MTRRGTSVNLDAVCLAFLALAVCGCSESTVPAGPGPHLTLLSGNGQVGPAGDTLPEPLVLRLADDEGRPVAGATITWTSPDPAGRFVPEVAVTDAGGLVRVRWVLGVPSGTQSARATVTAWDDALTVNAVAAAGLRAVALM